MNCGTGAPALIAHVIHRLDVGGLENGVVNLINHLPPARFRHAVICLTRATAFRERIADRAVVVHELGKREGNNPALHWRLWRLFRQLRPDVVHSRNIATLEAQIAAFCAGVPVRIHGEHGRDAYDVDGSNRKYRALRRVLSPLVQRWTPMSRDLEAWLVRDVGLPPSRITQLYNGVDLSRFRGATADLSDTPLGPWHAGGCVVFGTVGRMETIKDPLNLAQAFVALHRDADAGLASRLRLVMVGDGRLQDQVRQCLEQGGVLEKCWLPGARDDVPRLLSGMHVFVLPSLGEGISNTILEAMACGRPVVATAVGGNPELVTSGTGKLVPAGESGLLAQAMSGYANDSDLRLRHGEAARVRVTQHFSLDAMVARYQSLYEELLAPAGRSATRNP